MTTPEIIEACANTAQRPFLVIGGHAVIAHGHARNTVDLDLLACKTDRESWTNALVAIGYQSRNAHENFEQYSSTKGDIDVDLMFVNEATFDAMFAASTDVRFGPIAARIPSLQHLIALKLHVLKQGLEHRILGDLDDVIQLVLANQVDLDRQEWKNTFEKYGTEELYQKVRRATQSR